MHSDIGSNVINYSPICQAKALSRNEIAGAEVRGFPARPSPIGGGKSTRYEIRAVNTFCKGGILP